MAPAPESGREESSSRYEELAELVRHHIDSYNYMVEQGLEVMVENIKPVAVRLGSETVTLSLINPKVYEPTKEGSLGTKRGRLLPAECRQAKISYTGKLEIDACIQVNDKAVIRHKFNFGQFPVMIKSNICHLRHANIPSKLVSLNEEAAEVGGYFILNGLERVVRCVILPKGNYPMSTMRGSFRDRREGYTEKAVVMRCVREFQHSLSDQSSITVKLYYLRSGSARLGMWIQGREYLLPIGIVLKALVETTDREVYEMLTCCYDEKSDDEKGIVGSQLVSQRARIILDEVRDLSLFTQDDCLRHIGAHFQPIMEGLEHETSLSAAHAIISNYILIHLNSYEDKFNLLIFMLQKLFSFVDQTSLEENSDALQNQEILLPGHLITIYLKEKLEDWLKKCKKAIQDEIAKKAYVKLSDFDAKAIMDRVPSTAVGLAVENMLKTGRLMTQTGLDMQQRAGYTVQAERLNYLRFLSFFRAVHRGASFAGLRTTSVRKLLPESWGFLCPVHTPDGEPCGLLNHMTSSCRITSNYDSKGGIKDYFDIRKSVMGVMASLGMTPALPKVFKAGPPRALAVLLDGRVIGTIASSEADKAANHLRKLKVSAPSAIPADMEVGYVPVSIAGPYPGLFLFTSPSRFVRPVKNLSASPENYLPSVELIGPFEQVFMEIACPDGGNGGRRAAFPATHEEIHPTAMLSVVASLTPWSDHNQSPRNMYQCQMAKQTMAFSLQALHSRADQKLYHLQTPQTPIVRTKAYTKYSIDEYPTGTNAIVAVLAYTGYDMEDAMILNKSSVDRGMCHGQIYQTETIDLSEEGRRTDSAKKTFRRSALDKSMHATIDSDGLPYVGQMIHPHEPYCSVYNEETSIVRTYNRKGSDPVYVDYVAVDAKSKNLQKVNIRFRHTRNPIIGDKFSSRHGQKGVCSQLWSDVDMPFSGNTGIRPDLIINPHAFPSRMTIAMLLESLGAKGGSLTGKFVDATPFRCAEDGGESTSGALVDELGQMLRQKGFNYLGAEVLYSGVYGIELPCEIFIGPVYYQRLRHMVSDKFQVRSTGTVDQVTRQPIKGRKRGGGIRFGEMERDAMLAHGASFLLHDRLHSCSDYHVADVCALCGSFLTSYLSPQQKRVVRDVGGLPPSKASQKIVCHSCGTSKGMETIAMPYVFRYLATELAAMNIRLNLKLNDNAGDE